MTTWVWWVILVFLVRLHFDCKRRKRHILMRVISESSRIHTWATLTGKTDLSWLHPACQSVFVLYIISIFLCMVQFQFVDVNHWQLCCSHLSEYREELPGNITPFTLFTFDAPFFLWKKQKRDKNNSLLISLKCDYMSKLNGAVNVHEKQKYYQNKRRHFNRFKNI